MSNVEDIRRLWKLFSFKSIALRYFYSFQPRLSPHEKVLIQSLTELKKDKNIIVSKPDKGNGIVIQNKSEYVTKMESILGDRVNFTRCTEDLYKSILKFEDKNNRLVQWFPKWVPRNPRVPRYLARGSSHFHKN